MLIFIVSVIAFLFGYLYGYKIKPHQRLREARQELKDKCRAVLEEGNKGVYKTIVTEENKSSELVVEVEELAVTTNGQVKVKYLSAFYKNPEFRTKKGEALMNEVVDLLGYYLPLHEIEWYDNAERREKVKNFASSL